MGKRKSKRNSQPEGIDINNAKYIGDKITEVLTFQSAKIKVIRYVRRQYVVNQNDENTNIVIAPYPSELPLKGANADASVLAHLITSKYFDHLPIARQLNIFRRYGIEIKESTYYDWVRQVASKLKPLYNLLLSRVQNATYIQADESHMPMQVNGHGKTKKCYNWFYLAPKEKAVLIDFQLGRGGVHADHFFNDFGGKYVQCDKYVAYDHLEKIPEKDIRRKETVLLGCWAHARRKFIEEEAFDKKTSGYAIRLIGLLYKIERWADEKGYSPKQRHKLRERWSIKIIQWLRQWAEDAYAKNPPKTKLSEAIAYMLKNIKRLSIYTTNGDFLIDNNPIENKVRPSVLVRKNFLFVGSENGGQWAAMFYSFFAICKLNEINPQTWIEDTLRKMNSTPEEKLETLLPLK